MHKGRQHPHRMLLPFWAGQLDVHCLGPSKRTGLLFLSLTDTIFLEKRFPHFIPKEQSIRGVQPCTSSRFFVYSKCARYKSKHESLLNKRSRNRRGFQPWRWRLLSTFPTLMMVEPMLMKNSHGFPSFLLSSSKVSSFSPLSCWSPGHTSPRFPPCIKVYSSSVLVLSCSKLLARPSKSYPESRFHFLVSINSTSKQHQQCLRHYSYYCSPTSGLQIKS